MTAATQDGPMPPARLPKRPLFPITFALMLLVPYFDAGVIRACLAC